jgi:sulfonate transport system ATP-binding protein
MSNHAQPIEFAPAELALPELAPAERAPAAVAIDGLSKRFDMLPVLDDLDLHIEPGSFVALLGRSGSGKSTLLRILAGFDDGFTGSVQVAAKRAIVFQEPRLLPWSRVLANVTLGLSGGLSAGLSAPDAEERGRAALKEVGLGDKTKAWPITLSGGEAQRASLARALVREPDLLMLDEPFGALDALTRIKMHELVQKLCAVHKPAVLLVTHDVEEAIALADRILVLREGKLAYDEPVTLSRPRTPGDPGFGELRARLLAELGVISAETAGYAQMPARRAAAE